MGVTSCSSTPPSNINCLNLKLEGIERISIVDTDCVGEFNARVSRKGVSLRINLEMEMQVLNYRNVTEIIE